MAYLQCNGMRLSIKSTSDDFSKSIFTVSTYSQYSGENDMQNNDIVDMLNYLYKIVAPTEELQKIYPYLHSIDYLGHTFLNAYLIVPEIERMVEFAEKNKDEEMMIKLNKIIKYAKQSYEESHQILQFDGM